MNSVTDSLSVPNFLSFLAFLLPKDVGYIWVDGQNLIFKTFDAAMQILCRQSSCIFICWLVDIAISYGINLSLKSNLKNSKEMKPVTISIEVFFRVQNYL